MEHNQGRSSTEEIDLRAVFSTIATNWRTILTSIFIAAFLAIAYLNLTTSKYESQMLIAPTSGNESNKMNIPSGLAGLAGIGLGDDSNAGFEKFKSLLTSRVLAQHIADETNFMPVVFDSQWNNKSSSWREPKGVTWLIKKPIKLLLNFPAWHEPGVEELSSYLSNEVKVKDVSDGAMIIIAFQHKNPAVAREFLTTLHHHADAILRLQELENAEKRVAKLLDILSTTKINEHREAVISILSQEQRKLLLAEVDRYFIADLVDPPSLPTSPISPNPRIVVLIFLFLGIFGALAVIAIKSAIVRNRP